MRNLPFAVGIAAIASVSCKAHPEPSPLGTFANAQLASWAAECASPLTDEHVCGRLPWSQTCGEHFHSADPGDWVSSDDDWAASPTRKIACTSPAWSLWTDDQGRIVTICADDVPHATPNSSTLRLLALITRHWDKAKADEMFAVINGHDLQHARVWSSWLQPANPRVIEPPDGGPPSVEPMDPDNPLQERCLEFMLHK